MAIFALVFVVGGLFLPPVWLRYFDKTEYIQYIGDINFDKASYAPCEEQVAQSTLKILTNSDVKITSRLYLQKSSDRNNNEVIKEYTFDTFLAAQPNPQTFTSRTQLPCDLKPGIYFYRGILDYSIKGIKKTTSFNTEQFTVVAGGE